MAMRPRSARRSDGPRSIVLATKVHEHNLSYADVLATTAESRERVRVDVVDLLYVHWPLKAYHPAETLRAFDELVDDGTIRNVGVSNFTPELLAESHDHLCAPIATTQVEMHPLLPQHELREYTPDHDIQLVAYAPLMAGAIFDGPEVVSVADKHGVSAP